MSDQCAFTATGIALPARQFAGSAWPPCRRSSMPPAAFFRVPERSPWSASAPACTRRRSGRRSCAGRRGAPSRFPAPTCTTPRSTPADCYVALSASGRSVEPARAMELRPRRRRSGSAKRRDMPLASVVRTMIATESGPDGGPNTTSYVGTLLALGSARGPRRRASRRERTGRACRIAWRSRPPRSVARPSRGPPRCWRDASRSTASGGGAAFGTAGYASLLIREAVRVRRAAMGHAELPARPDGAE